MVSYATYKIIHYLGIFTLITALASMSVHALRGGTRSDRSWRRPTALAHGISAFLIILGGFGMLARLGVAQDGLPGWIVAKLVIWVALAAAITLPYRGIVFARSVLLSLPILALAAGAIALFKPF